MASQFISKLKDLFSSKSPVDEAFFEDLSDILIEGDIGGKTAFELTEELEKRCKTVKPSSHAEVRNILQNILCESLKTVELKPEPSALNIYLMLGVNGTGKTTSAAKMADFYRQRGTDNIILAAADTFRAAAIEQLCIHGGNLGIRVVSHKHGGDPAAVVFDAADALASKGCGLVIADTAGRLHNKDNLVRELQKIDRIAASKASPGAYKKILVLDSTTGQNAFRQAEAFHEAVGIDAVFLSKHDSSAKGGCIFSVSKELGIPLAFIGSGETYTDIRFADAERFAADFFAE